MAIVALIIVVFVILFAVAVVSAGGDPVTLDLRVGTVHTTVAGVFAMGAATVVVAVIGLWLLRAGIRRARRRRAEMRRLRDVAATTAASRTDETTRVDDSAATSVRRHDETRLQSTKQPPERSPRSTTSDPDVDGTFESAPRDT